MTTLREFTNQIVYEEKGAGEAKRTTEELKGGFERAGEAAEGFITRARNVGQGLQEIGRLGKSFLNGLILNMTTATDEAAKGARAVGVTVGSFQELNFAAQLSGASARDVTNALTKLATGAREASLGTKTFKKAFKDLGVEVESGGQLRATDEILKDVSDRFAGMRDGAQKTAIAVKLFGKSGAALVPLLSEGRAGLEKMGAEARRLGIVLDAEAAKKAENFNDELLKARSAIQGVRNRLALALLPALTDGLRRFQEWITEGDRGARILAGLKAAVQILASVISTMAARSLAAAIAAGGRWLVQLAAATLQNAKLAIATLRTAAGTNAMAAAEARATIQTRALGAALGLLKATGVLLLAAAFADLFKLATGGESVIAKALGPEGAAELGGAIKSIASSFGEVLKLLAPIIGFLAKIAAFLIKHIAKALSYIGPIVMTIGKFFQTVWIVALNLIAKAVGYIQRAWAAVGTVVMPIVSAIRSAWDATIGRIIGLVGSLIEKLGGVKRIVDIILVPFRFMKKVLEEIVALIGKVVGAAAKAGRGLAKKIGLADIVDEVTGKPTSETVSALTPAGASPRPAGAEGGAVNATTTVNQTINAAPGMSPEDVARIANEQSLAAQSRMLRDAIKSRRR